jgi:hypothetical protein
LLYVDDEDVLRFEQTCSLAQSPPATTSCGGSAPSAISPSGSPPHPAWYHYHHLLLERRSVVDVRLSQGGGRVASVLSPAVRTQGEVAQRSLHIALHPRGGQQPRALGAPHNWYNTAHSTQHTAHSTQHTAQLSGSLHRSKGRRAESAGDGDGARGADLGHGQRAAHVLDPAGARDQ